MKPQTENWLKIAKYDLKAAKDNFKASNYLKVVEACHSSLEKLLKGIIVEHGKSTPPKIHDLLKLTSIALIKNLQADVKKMLSKLNELYMTTRYPENFEEVISYLSKDKTKEILKSTERIFIWLEKKIK
jgi:HEPN domain-containing protein